MRAVVGGVMGLQRVVRRVSLLRGPSAVGVADDLS